MRSAAMRAPDSVGVAVAAGIEALRAAGSPTPRLDAELLAAHVLGRSRTWLIAHPDAPIPDDARVALQSAIARRVTGEPVAYIRGYKEWLSLGIKTDARALVPRPETELLAEAAIDEVAQRLTRANRAVVAWEVATGSGAVAVALALRFGAALSAGRLVLVASDASPDALSLASENLAEHGVERLVSVVHADLLSPAGRAAPRPDVVVANLPYLATAEVDTATGSLPHEPRIALDGGPDGLDLIRRLLEQMPHHASAAATLVLEVAAGQADAVQALAPAGAAVRAIPDLSAVDRVVIIGADR